MRLVMSASCVALVLTAACSDSTAANHSPIVSPIVGSWTIREDLHPTGYLNRVLDFSADGTFSFSNTSYGVYGGSSLSGYTKMSGTYEIDGDRLAMTVTRTAVWDSFYGQSSAERVDETRHSVFDQARFRVVGPVLILDYISYPADAPEPATMSFMSLR